MSIVSYTIACAARWVLPLALAVTAATNARAQAPTDSAAPKQPAEIFRSESPFAATLTANLGRLSRPLNYGTLRSV